MTWDVKLHDAFEAEFAALERAVQTELLAVAKLLGEYGPQLGRPYVDTLDDRLLCVPMDVCCV